MYVPIDVCKNYYCNFFVILIEVFVECLKFGMVQVAHVTSVYLSLSLPLVSISLAQLVLST